jgi:hypothetical protein
VSLCLFFFFFLLLFICAYKALFISPPCPHPLPYHPLHNLPLSPTPSIPSRNYFVNECPTKKILGRRFCHLKTEEKVEFCKWNLHMLTMLDPPAVLGRVKNFCNVTSVSECYIMEPVHHDRWDPNPSPLLHKWGPEHELTLPGTR